MSNEGFKGDQVRVEKFSVATGPGGAPVLVVSIQFASEDGTVHAVAQHSFLLDPEVSTDPLAPAVAEVMRLITRRVEEVHFTRPNNASSPVFQGIAESLRGMHNPPDEPGRQG